MHVKIKDLGKLKRIGIYQRNRVDNFTFCNLLYNYVQIRVLGKSFETTSTGMFKVKH